MVNIRLAMIGKRREAELPAGARERRRDAPHAGARSISRDARKPVPCPVYQREQLGAGNRIAGPALIQEHGTTTVLFEHDACMVAPSGELIIAVGGA